MSAEEQDSLEPAITAVRYYIFLLFGTLRWRGAEFHPVEITVMLSLQLKIGTHCVHVGSASAERSVKTLHS